jgi:predicted  nucleic acid-binding Zn-ribbon protein
LNNNVSLLTATKSALDEMTSKYKATANDLDESRAIISEARKAILDAHKANEQASKDFLESHRAQKSTIASLENKLASAVEEKTLLSSEVSMLKAHIKTQHEDHEKVCSSKDETMQKVNCLSLILLHVI